MVWVPALLALVRTGCGFQRRHTPTHPTAVRASEQTSELAHARAQRNLSSISVFTNPSTAKTILCPAALGGVVVWEMRQTCRKRCTGDVLGRPSITIGVIAVKGQCESQQEEQTFVGCCGELHVLHLRLFKCLYDQILSTPPPLPPHPISYYL